MSLGLGLFKTMFSCLIIAVISTVHKSVLKMYNEELVSHLGYACLTLMRTRQSLSAEINVEVFTAIARMHLTTMNATKR